MAPPSTAPSGAAVARHCAQRYQQQVGKTLPEDVAADLEKMALLFRQQSTFESLFIQNLVPWSQFNVPPNIGHDAIADFLACGFVYLGTTTNYDRLVEVAAQRLGEPDFLPIVSDVDLPRTTEHRPYLKVHGCAALGETRATTIWCKEQLDADPVKSRTERLRTWLEANLLGRDILIVGFWSDWAYLSDIFASAFNTISPARVFLVDPSAATTLQTKAPELWTWANRPGIQFTHVQVSGALFLDELRQHFARVFIHALLDDASVTYTTMFGLPPPARNRRLDHADSTALYALRRDLTGVPIHQVVRSRNTRTEFRVRGAIHDRLLDRGATYGGYTYSFNGQVLRVIAGGGQLMSEVRARYAKEPPLLTPVDRVICVGAIPDPTPGDFMRANETPGIIRGGTPPDWTTQDDLLAELQHAAQ